jgi:hypothetical protein
MHTHNIGKIQYPRVEANLLLPMPQDTTKLCNHLGRSAAHRCTECLEEEGKEKQMYRFVIPYGITNEHHNVSLLYICACASLGRADKARMAV